MKDNQDIMVKDLIKKLEISENLAIDIMYLIRNNTDRYFRISQKEA